MTGGSYLSESLPLSAQDCINFVPTLVESKEGGFNREALFEAEGIELVKDLLTPYGCRGAHLLQGVPHWVFGEYLYRLNEDLTTTRIGRIAGHRDVSMTASAKLLCIVDPAASAYVYDSTTGNLNRITDTDYLKSDTTVYQDGYFIFTVSDQDLFFVSNIENPQSIDPLLVGSAEVKPDRIVTAYVSHNELHILGSESIEVFRNSGGAGFPFSRVPGMLINAGCLARKGIVEMDSTYAFLGTKKGKACILQNAGNDAIKISTPPIDEYLQRYTADELKEAVGFSYGSGASDFIAFSVYSERIPSKTFVYDVQMSKKAGVPKWHERQSGRTENGWNAKYTIRAYGKTFCGDTSTGRIGEIKRGTYTEYDLPIYRQKTSIPLFGQEQPLIFGKLVAHLESGVGTATASPEIELQYSDDGARTFDSFGFQAYGKQGEFSALPKWYKLGYTPVQRVFRLKTNENAPARILKIMATVEGGIT